MAATTPESHELGKVAESIPPRALDAEHAAAYLGRPRSAGTLANWRSMGKGPRYIRVLGRPVYLIDDLDAYLAAGGDE